MKYIVPLVGILLLCYTPQDQENAGAFSTGIISAPATKETWVYFSQTTFMSQHVPAPHVSRKLSPPEEALLDSVLKGYFDPAIDPNAPKVVGGCWWPKHAVFFREDTNSVPIHISFECGRVRSSKQEYQRGSLDAWKFFFQRIGWPVERSSYAAFFERAKTDSVFRAQQGNFQF